MGKCKDCLVGLFGACSGDYCRVERGILIEQAQHLAGQHGHVLGEFVKVKNRPIWEARCVQCGQGVAVTLDPAPGEPDVYGDALTTPCPEAEAVSSSENA